MYPITHSSQPNPLPSSLPSVPWRYHSVDTDDAVQLSAQSVGPSPEQAPTVLLANGIGVTTPGLDFLAQHLMDRFHVVCWDYRGTGLSQIGERREVRYDIPRHATDALQVLDALEIHQSAVLGWSMGVPVGLEMIRAAPHRVAALGALFGAAGRPFEAAFPAPMAKTIFALAKGLSRFPWPGQAVLDLATALPSTCWKVCTSLGFVGGETHEANFTANVEAVAGADRAAYFSTMVALMEHDASDMLASVSCPVLVVGGERDWVTPPKAARALAEGVPGARLVMLERATHFGVIEYAKELYEPIDELLKPLLGAPGEEAEPKGVQEIHGA